MNLTVLNGKRKGELHAFFGFMLSKISGRPTFAWVRIQGCTFLIYGVGYFNPIHISLQSHATNKVHTPGAEDSIRIVATRGPGSSIAMRTGPLVLTFDVSLPSRNRYLFTASSGAGVHKVVRDSSWTISSTMLPVLLSTFARTTPLSRTPSSTVTRFAGACGAAAER